MTALRSGAATARHPVDNTRARRLDNLTNAKAYTKAGLYLFPSSSKTPLVPRFNKIDTEITPEEREIAIQEFEAKHGEAPVHVGATKDPAVISKMFKRHQDCVWSIACGPSKLVVIDADSKDNGPELIGAHFAEHGLPEGCVVVPTQSGGRHYIFKDPEGKFTNSAGLLKKQYGCDVRGKNGQYVSPGSIRDDGKTYGTRKDMLAFLRAYTQGKLPELPDHIVELIGTKPEAVKADATDADLAPVISELKEDWPDYADLFGPGGKYDLEALRESTPEFGELYDSPSGDHSADRWGMAEILLAAHRMSATHLAVFHGGWYGAGTLTDDGKGPGNYNLRDIAREWKKNEWRYQSDGEAFGAVDDSDSEATGTRELAEDKLGKRESEIAALDVAIERARDAAALDEPGAVDRLSDFERLRKRMVKELDRLTNSEAERAAVRTKFLFARDFDSYTPPDQLIESLIPAVGLTIFVGDANVGKTFVLMEMVRCLEADGEKFLGRNVDQCGALLVTGEGHAGLGSRLSAIRKRWPDADIAVHTELPSFADNAAAAIRKLAAILDEREAVTGRKVCFLALDNLLLMAGKADVNTTPDSGPILKALTGFANERKISIVLAAHENRNGKEAGSYAWKALCDNMIFLKSVAGKAKLREITGANGKVRDGERDVSLTFKLAVVDLGVKNKWGNKITSCVVEPVVGPEMPAVTDDEDAPTIVRPDRLEHRLQDVLDVFEREGERQKATDESTWAAARRIELPVSEIQAAVNARRTAEGLVALGRSTVNDHVKAAVERGDLEAGGTAARPLYKLA